MGERIRDMTDKRLAELEDTARCRLSPEMEAQGHRLNGAMAIAVRDQEAVLRFADLVSEVRRLRAAITAMTPVVEEAEQWDREFIGDETSYDLRLKAAIDTYRAAKEQGNG